MDVCVISTRRHGRVISRISRRRPAGISAYPDQMCMCVRVEHAPPGRAFPERVLPGLAHERQICDRGVARRCWQRRIGLDIAQGFACRQWRILHITQRRHVQRKARWRVMQSMGCGGSRLQESVGLRRQWFGALRCFGDYFGFGFQFRTQFWFWFGFWV